jgi:hypothetical protein
MSDFIERSKHKAMTAEVEAHFNGANQGQSPGTSKTQSMPMWGDPGKYNPPEGGIMESNPSYDKNLNMPRSAWNAPGQNLPRETGVNYTPRDQAGHTTTQKPVDFFDLGF